MTALYFKVGRRYVPWAHEQEPIWADRMRVGQWRMTYCYADAQRRYIYDVTPDKASFAAACELAFSAMCDAMQKRAEAHAQIAPEEYTKQQQRIIARFRAEMIATGALLPLWWTYGANYEIAQAGIDAVKNWAP